MVCPRTPAPGDEGPEDDNVIIFKPEADAPIEKTAAAVYTAMQRLDAEAEIHFPNFVLEVPREAMPQDIVEAYRSIVPARLPEVRATERRPAQGSPKGPGG